jgi:hypothetical protein
MALLDTCNIVVTLVLLLAKHLALIQTDPADISINK